MMPPMAPAIKVPLSKPDDLSVTIARYATGNVIAATGMAQSMLDEKAVCNAAPQLVQVKRGEPSGPVELERTTVGLWQTGHLP